MRKLLPKTSNNPRGFTLIELMIVITIMAILAVIAIAIYTGLQARARNAKREGEMNAIAKAFEVNKIPSKITYDPLQSIWFPGSQIPNNFVGDTPHYVLLYMNEPGVAISAPSLTQWPPTSAVPTGAGTIPSGKTPQIVDINNPNGPFPGGVPAPLIYSFLICALLEPEVIGTTTRPAFCIPSSQ